MKSRDAAAKEYLETRMRHWDKVALRGREAAKGLKQKLFLSKAIQQTTPGTRFYAWRKNINTEKFKSCSKRAKERGMRYGADLLRRKAIS